MKDGQQKAFMHIPRLMAQMILEDVEETSAKHGTTNIRLVDGYIAAEVFLK